MKLDITLFRYLGREEIRVLVAIEMGMKNHEIVPTQLIESIAKLRRGNCYKVIQTLLKYKLISHDNKLYDGYALTYQGYDTLAIHCFMKRGHIVAIGNMIGTGKESDIYICMDASGNEIVLKLARLGRISFRAVKTKRDYLKYRSKNNWFYLSRLAAIKEYGFMQALHQNGFPTPRPIDQNRHAVLMTRIEGYPLINIREIENPDTVLDSIINLAIRIGEYGLVHSDYNQFNLLVSPDEEVFVIDFPQMISSNHPKAEQYWRRDLECIVDFFWKKFGVEVGELPKLEDIEVGVRLDVEIKASGFIKENLKEDEIDDLDYVQLEGGEDEEVDVGNLEDDQEEVSEEAGEEEGSGEEESGEEGSGEEGSEEEGSGEEEAKKVTVKQSAESYVKKRLQKQRVKVRVKKNSTKSRVSRALKAEMSNY